MVVQDSAATFIGLTNDNDFFSAHYLAEVFQGDFAEVVKDWDSREEQTDFTSPHRGLRNLNQRYFAMRHKLKTERSATTRIALQREFYKDLIAVLGIPWQPHNREIAPNTEVPVLSVLGDQLWVLGALDADNEGEDPLSLNLHSNQFYGEGPHHDALSNSSWYSILNEAVFRQSSPHNESPPRWVLLISDRQGILIDRYKWSQNRMLRFDWEEILGRRDDKTLKASAVLLHRESLAPEDQAGQGQCRLDNLDENSHKHAFAVSDDLKYALRQAIEQLGNEATVQLIAQAKDRKEGIYSGSRALDPDQLSKECLRYMYRILFLFYIEARPELGYLPHQHSAWRSGYSMDSLRDLEMVRLTTEESRQGEYLHHSLQRMFGLIYQGYNPTHYHSGNEHESESASNAFTLQGLDSHLFDPAKTPLLNRVIFSNATLQQVVQFMSLTRAAKGKRRRGRVSYTQLGINQLGAVYEALLSYRGFFATEDLYEVAAKGSNINPDELETGYFVNRQQLEEFDDKERVYDKDGGKLKLRVHEKDKFIYRMAGRDREKSASYYTPEVLTKSLVKYTLKERLGDTTQAAAENSPSPLAGEGPGERGKQATPISADEILNLTICEPAMGSAAFLNEAVNQLAEAYLTRKQQELGERIPHEDYQRELQRVKMHIADHNVYGVDLNPIAVELAEVSLWLNALSGGHNVPWFGYQLFTGNSLVGARREVYASSALKKQHKDGLWHKNAPRRLPPETLLQSTAEGGRKAGEIYHFLLPDLGMVGYKDKVARQLRPEAFKQIKDWKADFCAPLDDNELRTLELLSQAVDRLWREHTQMLVQDRKRTQDNFHLWGQGPDEEIFISTREKDDIHRHGIFNTNARIASPYRRLKLAMDYWCALWFWPLDKVDQLPDRQKWLFDLNTILNSAGTFEFAPEQEALFSEPSLSLEGRGTEGEGETKTPSPLAGEGRGEGEESPFTKPQNDMFAADDDQLTLREETKAAREVSNQHGDLNLDKLFKQPFFATLNIANQLGEQFRFFHWELAFADIFAKRGGFDITLGNPPWRKVEWQEGGILGDHNPAFVLHKLSAKQLTDEREAAFERSPQLEQAWFAELAEAEGSQAFLNATQNYPQLSGQKANLYKCFLPRAWGNVNQHGVTGFLHPEGIYDDPKGGNLREAAYPRLKAHFQFRNELKLFSIQNTRKFSINIYGKPLSEVGFLSLSNLFHPRTIDGSIENDQVLLDVGIKSKSGGWNLAGGSNRVIFIGIDLLKLFLKVYDDNRGDILHARLPAIHVFSEISVIEKLSKSEFYLSSYKNEYSSTSFWNESNAQDDGVIQRETNFPEEPEDVILSGSHIYVNSTFYNSAQRECKNAKNFDSLDLVGLPKGYLPRTNYQRSSSCRSYNEMSPITPWGVKFSGLHRISYRAMLDSGMERTLICSIIPPGFAHINGISSYAFKSLRKMLLVCGLHSSLIFDFLVKSTGKQNLHTTLNSMPVINLDDKTNLTNHLVHRVVSLNAVTDHYNSIIDQYRDVEIVRSSFYRRKASIEIDVIVAKLLSIDLKELIEIYKTSFWVLKQNEDDTFYDQTGRIVFTPSKGLVGVGLPRKASKKELGEGTHYRVNAPGNQQQNTALGWEDIQHLQEGSVYKTYMDDTLPGGPTERTVEYKAPFFRPDREEDYAVAWEIFNKEAK